MVFDYELLPVRGNLSEKSGCFQLDRDGWKEEIGSFWGALQQGGVVL